MSKTIFSLYTCIFVQSFGSGGSGIHALIPMQGSATNHKMEISLAAPQILYCVLRESHAAKKLYAKEGEVLVSCAKCWDEKSKEDQSESMAPCHDTDMVELSLGSSPVHSTVLAAEDYISVP